MMKWLATLELTWEDINRLTDAQAWAICEPFTLAEVKAIYAREKLPAGDNSKFVACLHNGYRVVTTVEEQPSGWYLHISLSKNGKHPPVQEGLAMFSFVALGFQANFDHAVCYMWEEEEDGQPAINALIPYYNPKAQN